MHVVLAGGGSAGHTSPLIATAERLLARDGVTVSCVGTSRGLETRVIPAAGLELDLIDPVPLPRRPSAELARVPVRLWRAVAQARAILRRRGADVVVGYGGYVSSPAYVAARLAGVPIVLHEQNAVAGVANRLGAALGATVAVTYPGTPLPRAQVVGLPLRAAITELAGLDPDARAAERSDARRELGLEGDRPTLLVSGGSQGARSLNDATTGARDRLLAAGVDVVHVWGPKNLPADAARVTDAATGATYLPLAFVERMTRAYAAADLMLARSGSNTVNEVGAIGLPAIFVPLPHGNGEQARNGRALVEAGGAVMIADGDLTPDRLAAEVHRLTADPALLPQLGVAGRALVPADAAERLAALIVAAARR